MTKMRMTIQALTLCGAIFAFAGAACAGSYDYGDNPGYYPQQPSYGHSYSYQHKYYKPKHSYSHHYDNDSYNGGYSHDYDQNGY